MIANPAAMVCRASRRVWTCGLSDQPIEIRPIVDRRRPSSAWPDKANEHEDEHQQRQHGNGNSKFHQTTSPF
jgi:hypothetical protein